MPSAPEKPQTRVATISVIVPSWRRPADLARCLRALAAQRVAPFEVIVGARAGDAETEVVVAAAAARASFPVRIEWTAEGGVIAAMNAALVHSRGDITALTDDDAEPRPDWIERLNDCFIIPFVGAAGGRDWQQKERGDRHDVGRVQWFGRVIGNHHLGAGPARPVDVLKGANLAVRTHLLKALRFDTRLKGGGAQMFWELALCLPLRRAGWTLIYDPAIAVDHHIAVRHDDDQRHREGGTFAAAAQRDAVHNETLVMLEHVDGARRVAYLVWAFLVGTRIEPGMLQVLRLIVTGERSVFAKWRATMAGRRDGWRTWRTIGADAAARLSSPPRTR
jgi:GT2 family glycosyltransferase